MPPQTEIEETEDTEQEVSIEPPTRDVEVDSSEAKTPVDKPAQGAQPVGRKERRARAIQDERSAREAAQSEASQLRQELEQTRREVAEMRGRQEERDRLTQQSQPSQHAVKLKNLRSQWETHAVAAQNPKTDEATRRQHIDAAHDLEVEMSRLQYKMFREEEQKDAPPDQTAMREAAQREENFIVGRFPWLDGNEEAHGYVWNKFNALVKAGKPRNRETMVLACTTIAKTFGFGGNNSNGNGHDNSNSRRYAAVPGGEGAGGDDDGPRTIKVGPREERLAIAMANNIKPGLSKEEALKLWAQTMANKRKEA